MALQQYSGAEVYFNGLKLMEEAQVSISRNTHASKIATLARGFAGIIDGASDMEINVSNAVPGVGFELNPGAFMNLKKEKGDGGGIPRFEITIIAAGRTLTTVGQIMSDNFDHAVNSASKLDFVAVCDPADWAF